ncbi:MAG TPA: hypothetical protein VFO89_06530 [Thermoanaerobaculia bacterium]|nr:hypothetical protein [Thermoanaerobaculia bacterium]
MTGATLEQAYAAKAKMRELLADLPVLSALGIAVLADGFGVKVNLSRLPARAIPDQIDGVPVVIDIVGRISPL